MSTPIAYKKGYPFEKNSLVVSIVLDRDPTSADIKNPQTGGYIQINTICTNRSTNASFIYTSAGNWAGITDAASGNVDGPVSATDNALARFDGTTGKLIQNSAAVLTDGGALSGIRATLLAGTATAGTAPLKLTSGVDLTAPEAGAIEYDGAHITYTNTAVARKTLATGPAVSTDLALAKYTGILGEIQNSGTTLSAANVMTFPAQGGVVLTAGGANPRKGVATLVAGTVTVTTTAAVTGSVICLTIVTLGTVATAKSMLVTITNGVNFAITSEDNTDTSVLNWAIVA